MLFVTGGATSMLIVESVLELNEIRLSPHTTAVELCSRVSRVFQRQNLERKRVKVFTAQCRQMCPQSYLSLNVEYTVS